MEIPHLILPGEGGSRAIVKNHMALDPLWMGRRLWPALFTWETPPFHRIIVEDLLRLDDRFFNYLAPRSYGKSAIVAQTIGGLWHPFLEDRYRHLVWLILSRRGQQPPPWADEHYRVQDQSVLFASRTQKHSKKMLGGLMGVWKSDGFAELFGAPNLSAEESYWRQDEASFQDREGRRVSFMTTGTGQQVRGLREGVVRFTFISLDDLEDETNTKTAESIHANLAWLLGAARYSLDAKRGRAVQIATPQNASCACERLADPRSGWKTRRFPGIVRNAEDGIQGEHALWEALETLEKLKKEELQAQVLGMEGVFSREVLVTCASGADAAFPTETYRYYRGRLFHKDGLAYLEVTHLGQQGVVNPPELKEPLVVPVNVFLGVDPAAGKSARASRTAIVPLAVSRSLKFILPYWSRRVHPGKILNHANVMYRINRPIWIRFETISFQELLVVDARKEYKSWSIRETKDAYVERMTGDFIDGKMILPVDGGIVDGQAMSRLLRDELEKYPFHPSSNDLVHALYVAWQKTYSPSHYVIDRPRGEARLVVTGEDWITAG